MNLEQTMGHGANKINRFYRWFHRSFFRKKFKNNAGSIPFNWSTGYDVRNKIGPISVKNQGTNDSCGGQAGSYFLEIQRRLQGIDEGSISAKSIYSRIFYPGGGTTVVSLENQICTKGANLEKDIPSYDSQGNPLSEPLMENVSWLNQTALLDAISRYGYTPYDVTVDIDTVAAVVQDWGACIMEIRGQNGHIPSWTSSTPQPPSPTNQNPIWAHFMCIIGAKIINGKKYVICLQSEGEGWGDNGIQYISEDYFKSGYIVDCFTLCYDSKLIPSNTNFDQWSWFLRWVRLSWGLLVDKLN